MPYISEILAWAKQQREREVLERATAPPCNGSAGPEVEAHAQEYTLPVLPERAQASQSHTPEGSLAEAPEAGDGAGPETAVKAGASCAHCGKTQNLLLCARCQAVHYCSQQCQRVDHRRHKREDGCGRQEERESELEAKRKAAEEALKSREMAKLEAKRKAVEDAKQKATEDAERKAAEEALKAREKAKLEAQRKAVEEAKQKATEEAERKAAKAVEEALIAKAREIKLEAKRRAAEEVKQKAVEEAERKSAEEALKTREMAKLEAKRKAVEEAKQKAVEEAEQNAAEEALTARQMVNLKAQKAVKEDRQFELEAKRRAAQEAKEAREVAKEVAKLEAMQKAVEEAIKKKEMAKKEAAAKEAGVQLKPQQRSWAPIGLPTFFPEQADCTDKTPMGPWPNLFGMERMDKSFASMYMMANDRAEMNSWMGRRMHAFSSNLANKIQPTLERVDIPGQAADGEGPYRTKAIYIAGVEGTGHHGFGPMLMYPALCKYGTGLCSWWRSLREVLMKTPPWERHSRLRQLLAGMHVKERPHLIMESASYPFGEEGRERWAAGCTDPDCLEREERSGNPGNSVDLAEFVDLFQEHGDVRVLVLHRGLVSAAWSHKEWDDGLVEHAQVLALFSTYLTKVLRGLDPEIWRWVAYEDVCQAHARQDYDALAPLAEFLGFEKDQLAEAFEHFRPSSKDAAAEMSHPSLQAIQSLEEEHSRHWFHALFPDQQLRAKSGSSSAAPQQSSDPLAEPEAGETSMSYFGDEDLPVAQVNQKLKLFVDSLDAQQAAAWDAVNRCAPDAPPDEAESKMERLDSMLHDDQRFLLHHAMVKEQVLDSYLRSDLDASQYTCLHMWIEDRGFGSEVNNLITAAIYCEAHGLACVVEDGQWNSGRLHDYLEAEPVLFRSCPCADELGRCRQLEIRRHKQVATPGWFALGKHALEVSFEKKADCAKRVWRYTEDTEWRVEKLNQELDLPIFYVAVHLRRGDKVFTPSGKRGGETLPIDLTDYARKAVEHLTWPCTAIAVCTDDVAAAEEFNAKVQLLSPGAEVRWRARAHVPKELRRGHWQKLWNALPLEERRGMTHEFLADIEVLRSSHVCLCTHSSNVGRLVALLRDGMTISLDEEWTNT